MKMKIKEFKVGQKFLLRSYSNNVSEQSIETISKNNTWVRISGFGWKTIEEGLVIINDNLLDEF